MSKLITVQLHPSTLALLAVIADTELSSANHDYEFQSRKQNWSKADLARERSAAWAVSASNLNIAAGRVEG